MDYLAKRSVVASQLVDSLSAESEISRDIAEILCMRGITESDDVRKFLNPMLDDLTPVMNYNGMREACDRIKRAVDYDESVVIFGDYDCDGVCSTAILYLFLTSLGVNVNYYIPHRKKEGYGVSREALESIAENYAPDLIITVDCGISSHEEILYGMDELGLEFIVTDHHEPPDVLPPCIVIDPKVDLREDTFNELCGAGVVLRLCEAIGGDTALMYYVDLACIATIGDLVPLVGDNRILVNYGMQIVNARARMNIKLLLESSNFDPLSVVTSQDIAYKIVPKINAIGRLSDPLKAVMMLTDGDYFYVKHVVENATEYNTERQKLTEDLTKDVLVALENYDLINNKIIVLSSDKWEAGVLGIACSKIVQMFRRPCLLLTKSGDIYRGSGRSIEGVNLYECIESASTHLLSYGGHKMACGISIEKESIEKFTSAINEYVKDATSDIFLPHTLYDLERNVEDISLAHSEELAMLEPFGMANPMVSYRISNWQDKFSRITVTKHIKSKHRDDLELVFFDGYSAINTINDVKKKDIVAEISNKIFNNRKYTQGIVRHIEYDMASYDYNQDYLAVKYLYNARYDDSSVFKCEYINEKDVALMVDNDLYGTCFVASSEETFNKYRELLADILLRVDVRNISEVNPYNRLVLDMDVAQNLAYYRTIVFLDEPISKGIIDYYKLNINARIVCVKNSRVNSYIERVKAKFPNLDTMRGMFSGISKVLTQYPKLANLAEVYDKYAEQYGECIVQFYIAMFVFVELKIIRVLGGVLAVDKSVKSSLENSKCYANIRELVGG